MNEAVTKLLKRESELEVELSNVRRNIEATRSAVMCLDGKVGVLTLYVIAEDGAFTITPRIAIEVSLADNMLEQLRLLFTWGLGHADRRTLVLTGPALTKRTAPADWRVAVKGEIETLRQLGVTVRQGAHVSLMMNMLHAAVCALEPVLKEVNP